MFWFARSRALAFGGVNFWERTGDNTLLFQQRRYVPAP
jgi:hypothetical protein